MLESLKYNNEPGMVSNKTCTDGELFDEMADQGTLKIAVIIAGQGPMASVCQKCLHRCNILMLTVL